MVVMTKKHAEDSFVMYLVVRESLGMSVGKTAAQCCHAVQRMVDEYAQSCDENNDSYCGSFDDCHTSCSMSEWMTDGLHTKIVLGANENEWKRLLSETDEKRRFVVTDAGLTELEPGTDTVMAFVPMRRIDRPACIKRLQLLR